MLSNVGDDSQECRDIESLCLASTGSGTHHGTGTLSTAISRQNMMKGPTLKCGEIDRSIIVRCC